MRQDISPDPSPKTGSQPEGCLCSALEDTSHRFGTCPHPLVGTVKGNVIFYDHQTTLKIPILGKHTKRITCGCWTDQDMICMASEDKTLSITSAEGDAIERAELHGEPSQLSSFTKEVDGEMTTIVRLRYSRGTGKGARGRALNITWSPFSPRLSSFSPRRLCL